MDIEKISSLSLGELLALGEFDCPCGKKHSAGTRNIFIEKNALSRLPGLLEGLGAKKPFILSGHDSFAAAGERVAAVLDAAGTDHASYVFPASPVAPDEHSLGSALMHFDLSCDAIIGIGSGVINDICKMLSALSGKPFILAATAPSMDGFASATSSMDRDGLKVSLNSAFACAVLADTDILCAAPMKLLQAGVGDMIAKYVSLAEWEIASILVDEYYCPLVAALVRASLERVVRAAPGLMRREEESVKAVMEGMVIAGMAMKYAGLSRPASGMEHYFSHIWDMRALAFGTGSELHGIQCGIATLYSLKVYEYIKTLRPDREKALSHAAAFDLAAWNEKLRACIGPGAEAMIRGEEKEGKYDREKHAARLERILAKWDEIMTVVNALPSHDEVLSLLQSIGAPTDAADFGYGTQDVKTCFTMTKDIRDKYIASRLLWDLGELDTAADRIFS